MASAPQGSDKEKEITGGPGEDPSCRVQNLVPTGMVFAASLERLNRSSVIHVLQQLAHELDVHCQTFGPKTTEEVGKLRTELLALLAVLEKTSHEHHGSLQIVNQHINELRTQLQKLTTNFEVTNNNAVTNNVDVKALRVQLGELHARLEKLQETTKELGPQELKQVEALVIKLLANYDLSTIISNTQVTVSGRVFPLTRLIEVLATTDKVVECHLDYNEKEIAGARFVLTDRTVIVFTCTRRELPGGKQVQYTFSAPDWKGVPASFIQIFERRITEMKMCGRTLALESYDGIFHSNLRFDLCRQAEGRVVQPPPAPPAPQAPQAPKPDDLKIIEGIGPKIAELLGHSGIVTFKQLAATEVGRLKEILAAGGSRFAMADPTTWPMQAKLAANGQWDELNALKGKLQAGRLP